MVNVTNGDGARAYVIGTGEGIPSKVLTNKDLEKIVDTSDEWIVQRTGIRERRMLSDGESSTTLIEKAARQALDSAGLTPEDLDMIVVGTVTADMITPSAACLLQNKLGIVDCPSFDVSAGCTGWIYAMVTADRFLKANPDMKILTVGAEMVTPRVDWADRGVCVIFGDGAGAAVVTGATDGRGLLADTIMADGSQASLLMVEGGGTLYPPSHEMVDSGRQYLRMDGNKIFKYAVPAMVKAVEDVVSAAGYTSKDIDYVIPHQANIRILEAVAKRVGVSMDKFHLTLQKYGNTSAATIPVAMHEALTEGKIKPGDLILTVCFGAGLTWGATLHQW